MAKHSLLLIAILLGAQAWAEGGHDEQPPLQPTKPNAQITRPAIERPVGPAHSGTPLPSVEPKTVGVGSPSSVPSEATSPNTQLEKSVGTLEMLNRGVAPTSLDEIAKRARDEGELLSPKDEPSFFRAH